MKVTLTGQAADNSLLISMLDYFGKKFTPSNYNPKTIATNFIHDNKDVDEGEVLFGLPLIWSDDLAIFDDKNTLDSAQFYPFITQFIEELKGWAAVQYVKNKRGFERMDIPPIEAYQYVGHNKLDIKESLKSAALSYEK